MAAITDFAHPDDPQVRVLRHGEIAGDGGCVLLWVQRSQRAQSNPAANLAIEIATEYGLPVVAMFCLVPAHPEARLRPYHFMAEGLAHLVRIPDPISRVASDLREGPDPLETIRTFDLDMSVGPAPELHGGSAVARERLKTFVAERVDRYDRDRQRADMEGGTSLSPWLHYGQISPVEVALAVLESDAPAAATESFLDELVTQRELAINFALRNPDYDSWKGLPDWGRETLLKHATDPRPVTYTRSELEHAQTDDPLWNAAQTQMVNEGYMPNRLRMYWAKQLLRWSPSPEAAWDTTVYINNTYFLDGRDANSYANIAWCIGGRHDRPFGPEKDIFGLVRPMGMGAMKRTFDVDAYIRKVRDRWGEESAGGSAAKGAEPVQGRLGL